MYQCPLCHDIIDPKALAGHLRKSHDIPKSDGVPFDQRTNIYPGHLACKALQIVLFDGVWIAYLFPESLMPDLVQLDTRFALWCSRPLGSRSGQHASLASWLVSIEMPTWTPELARNLIGPPLQMISCELFTPESKLNWFYRSLGWLLYYPDVP